jgi:hypothetical protein
MAITINKLIERLKDLPARWSTRARSKEVDPRG